MDDQSSFIISCMFSLKSVSLCLQISQRYKSLSSPSTSAVCKNACVEEHRKQALRLFDCMTMSYIKPSYTSLANSLFMRSAYDLFCSGVYPSGNLVIFWKSILVHIRSLFKYVSWGVV